MKKVMIIPRQVGAIITFLVKLLIEIDVVK